jgi:hypothetical protein
MRNAPGIATELGGSDQQALSLHGGVAPIIARVTKQLTRATSRSGLDEGQQVSIDRRGLGGRHAVREAVVGLQRPVLHELRG